MKKKMLMIIPQMRHGGAERFVSRFSSLLEEKYDITIILFDDRNMTYDLSVKYLSLNVYPNQNTNSFKRIINIIKRTHRLNKTKKKLKADISISFGDSANIVNALSKKHGKTILSIRGYDRLESMKKGFINKIYDFLFSRSDMVICVSRMMESSFREYFPKQKNKVAVLYNPYEFDEIEKLSEIELDKHEKFFKNNKVIISVGSYVKEKGYWHLIKAFSLLKQKHLDAKLFIIGNNNMNYKENLIELAKAMKIEKDIIFEDFDNNPFKFIKNSYLYVLSSTSEGFPNSLVEAMVCGIPVLASDCNTGPREILSLNSHLEKAINIEEADFGILVPPMTKNQEFNQIYEKSDYFLYEGMIKYFDSINLANNYGEIAKKRSLEFSNYRCKAEFIQLIESLE